MDLREIAKSIADELRQHPERWSKGYCAMKIDGTPVFAQSEEACTWCVLGHFWKHDESIQKSEIAMHIGMGDVAKWNDAPERTVTDIIAMCDKVAQS